MDGTDYYMTIVVAVSCSMLLIWGWFIHPLQDKQDFTSKRLLATMNCYTNTAYPRTALDQCIDDYFDMRGWK